MFKERLRKSLLTKLYQKGRRFSRKAGLLFHCCGVKNFFLPKISSLQFLPLDIWHGSAQRGQSIRAGFFSLLDEKRHTIRHSWTMQETLPPSGFATYLYGFSWIRDLKATGETSARRLARKLIESWILESTKKEQLFDRKTRPLVAARRVSSWILLYDFFGSSSNDSFKSIFFPYLQKDYKHIKQAFGYKAYSWVDETLLLKSLLEYNVYVAFDAPFFKLLLWRLYEKAYLFYRKKGLKTLSIIEIFDYFCVLIDIRNVLRQWENSWRTDPHSVFFSLSTTKGVLEDLFKFVFKKTQEALSSLMVLLRFYRNSHGTFSQIKDFPQQHSVSEPTPSSQTLLREFALAENIDIALSQVEDNSEAEPPQDILRFQNKDSVLFLDLRIHPPQKRQLPDYQDNIMKSVLNFDWSVSSYDLVLKHSILFFPKTQVKDKTVSAAAQSFDFFQTEENGVFEFQSTVPLKANTLFSRDLRFFSQDKLLISSDSFEVSEREGLAVLQFQLGCFLKPIERRQHSNVKNKTFSFFEILPLDGHKKKKTSYLLFVIETKSPVHLKIKTHKQGPLITLYCPVEGDSVGISWSFQILNN